LEFAKELNQTLDLSEEQVSWKKERSFSFNQALNETEYFSFERESKVSPTDRRSMGLLSTGREN